MNGSQSPDPLSRACPCGGPGHEGDGEQEASVTCLSYQGTTGSPKGATLSHYNIVNNANIIGERMKLHLKVRGCWLRLAGTLHGWGVLLGSPCWVEELASGALGSRIDLASCLHLQTPEESRVILPTPLYHCLGSVGGTMVSMMHGVTLILSSPIFDGKKALEAVSKERWASVGSYLLAHETPLFLTPGPRSLSRMSPPSRQETGRQGSGAPQESISSCLQRTPACSPQWQPWPLL